MNLKEKACIVLTGFLFFYVLTAEGQDQKIADSLKQVYTQSTLTDSVRYELLRELAFNETNDLKLAMQYADALIALAEKNGHHLQIHRGYYQKGSIYRLQGDLDKSIAAFFKSGEAARKANSVVGEGSTYGAIADIYAVSNNHNNARLYYTKAIATLRKTTDSIALASVISNAGDEFLNHQVYDSALIHFKEAKKIFELIGYETGKAYSLGNMGMVYANIGQSNLAERNINEAIRILEQAEDYYPICVYLISMCDIYMAKGDDKTALNYALRSQQLAQQYGLKDQISDANLKLSELYEHAGDPATALGYYRSHIAYRDSVNNIKSVQTMADLRTDYEVSKKQTEVDLLNQQKRNQQTIVLSLIIILGLTTVILGTLYWYFRNISKQKKISESLLLNILPAETAKELKLNGKVDAVKFDEVTVLFTDFVSFSKYAEHIDPEHLVRSIDFYFKEFDAITTKYGLEKIKTIGDSYMCACGLPTANPSHASNVILAAKDMISLVQTSLHANDGLSHFDIRIGIHTGPVVAGIVGIKKWQYDIWGDTVNIASRMESKSEPGRINLSETTYQQIQETYPCEYRGEIEVKNRGMLKMYFLK
jgi:adenylate cyclase